MAQSGALRPKATRAAAATGVIRNIIASITPAFVAIFDAFGNYFNLSASFVSAALAHAASLSPPGAPLTATAPMVTLPTLMGTPPWALMVPGIVAGGAAVPGAGGCAGPEGRL